MWRPPAKACNSLLQECRPPGDSLKFSAKIERARGVDETVAAAYDRWRWLRQRRGFPEQQLKTGGGELITAHAPGLDYDLAADALVG